MHAKVIKKINVGSTVFFNKFDDFKPKDTDILCILNEPLFGNEKFLMKKNNTDYLFVFIGKEMTRQDLINYTTDFYQACTFIVPEFIEYLKEFDIYFTTEDLNNIRFWFEKGDDQHKYAGMICDYYIENNGFFLTEEQLNEAYKIYKKFR